MIPNPFAEINCLIDILLLLRFSFDSKQNDWKILIEVHENCAIMRLVVLLYCKVHQLFVHISLVWNGPDVYLIESSFLLKRIDFSLVSSYITWQIVLLAKFIRINKVKSEPSPMLFFLAQLSNFYFRIILTERNTLNADIL